MKELVLNPAVSADSPHNGETSKQEGSFYGWSVETGKQLQKGELQCIKKQCLSAAYFSALDMWFVQKH